MSKIARQTQTRHRTTPPQHDRERKPQSHVGEAKASVQPLSGFGEVSARAFRLSNRGIGATVAALNVSEQDIDQARAGTFGDGATAARSVRVASVGDATEAPEAIGLGLDVGCQTAHGSVGHAGVAENLDRFDHGPQQVFELGISPDVDNGRLFIFRHAPGLRRTRITLEYFRSRGARSRFGAKQIAQCRWRRLGSDASGSTQC